MAEQVEYTGLGYVEFEWVEEIEDPDSGRVKTIEHKVRWRRPRLRQYRELRNSLQELGRGTEESRERLGELLEELKDEPKGFDFTELDKVRDGISDYMIPWMFEADKLLAVGEHLPEDEGDWPSWMANAQLPTQVLNHWRDIPLAPGAKGTNSPLPR